MASDFERVRLIDKKKKKKNGKKEFERSATQWPCKVTKPSPFLLYFHIVSLLVSFALGFFFYLPSHLHAFEGVGGAQGETRAFFLPPLREIHSRKEII